MTKAKEPKDRLNMQTIMKIFTQVGTPGAPHRRLASLAGNWVTRIVNSATGL